MKPTRRESRVQTKKPVASPALKRWLRGKAQRQAIESLVGGLCFGALGLMVLSVTLYALAFVTLGVLLHFQAAFDVFGLPMAVMSGKVWCAVMGLWLLAIFLVVRKGDRSSPLVRIRGERFNRQISAETLGALASIVIEILISGPRLAGVALEEFRKCRRLLGLEIEGASVLLAWLLAFGRKISLDRLSREGPGVNCVRVVPQLRDLEGIIWLPAPSATIILSESLKQEIAQCLQEPDVMMPTGVGPGDRPADSPAQDQESPEVECYLALDLEPYAPLDQVKRRYREILKRHHPDKVRDRDESYRRQAEEKTRAAIDAYQTILRLASARDASSSEASGQE